MTSGFSVIVPVYNEEKIIRENMRTLAKACAAAGEPFEIIIVDNGSTDRTRNECFKAIEEDKRVKYYHLKEKGVGWAFKRGFAESKYDKILGIDADLTIDLVFIPKAVALLNENHVVVGSKHSSQERPFLRELASKVFIGLTNGMLGLNFTDYSIGAKGYSRAFLSQFAHTIEQGSAYVVKLLYFSRKFNFKSAEFAIDCKDERKSKFNFVREVFHRLANLFLVFFEERIANATKPASVAAKPT